MCDALKEALEKFRLPGPNIPPMPADIMTKILKVETKINEKSFDKETKALLEDMSDGDMHPREYMFGFAEQYASMKSPALKEWLAKLGVPLEWLSFHESQRVP